MKIKLEVSYFVPRGLIEGTAGGCYAYVSEGIMTLMAGKRKSSIMNDNGHLKDGGKSLDTPSTGVLSLQPSMILPRSTQAPHWEIWLM